MPQQPGDFAAQKTCFDAAAEYDRVSVRYWPFAARTVERWAQANGITAIRSTAHYAVAAKPA